MTTTFDTIAENYYAKFLLLTPRGGLTDAGKKFDRSTRRQPLRVWASGDSACLRKLELSQDRVIDDERILHPSTGERKVEATLTVAYPVLPALYGTREIDDMNEVMDQDASHLRDTLIAPPNFVSGQNLCHVTSWDFDRGSDTVWFLVMHLEITFFETQTLYT